MLDFFIRLWRNVCLLLESKAAMLRRLEKLEIKVYALEQDQKRILGLLRAQSRTKTNH